MTTPIEEKARRICDLLLEHRRRRTFWYSAERGYSSHFDPYAVGSMIGELGDMLAEYEDALVRELLFDEISPSDKRRAKPKSKRRSARNGASKQRRGA